MRREWGVEVEVHCGHVRKQWPVSCTREATWVGIRVKREETV